MSYLIGSSKKREKENKRFFVKAKGRSWGLVTAQSAPLFAAMQFLRRHPSTPFFQIQVHKILNFKIIRVNHGNQDPQ